MICYRLIALLITFIFITACTPELSPNQYYAENIGCAQQVEYGKVTKINVVQVGSRRDNAGPLVGTAAGATVGSSIGGASRVNILGALGGAVIGNIAGRGFGKAVTTQKAFRYIIHMENGRNISIVQGCEPTLHVGQRVMVLTGGAAKDRVVPA